MKIGYACLTVGVLDTDFKSCIKKNAARERLIDLIEHNLNSLDKIIDYNIQNNIRLFRITSDLIPFGSSYGNTVVWWEKYKDKLQSIGQKIKQNNIRVSMHPGQYTVLNSPNIEVVTRAVDDLTYHTRVLDSLELPKEHKIIVHIGGVYGDKKSAIDRFIDSFKSLDSSIKARIVIENDHKSYTIQDVLKISESLNIPVIFDNLHHQINGSNEDRAEMEWLSLAQQTWQDDDGVQKIHYSQQNSSKYIGAHSETITISGFMDFYNRLPDKDIDIMLEVKDKNISAIKCINMISKEGDISLLELEWSKYKYNILEKSPSSYLQIRNLLKDKDSYPVYEFYSIIEKALLEDTLIGNSINTLQHIWGYFKDMASLKEKQWFLNNIDLYKNQKVSLIRIKKYLLKLVIKYDVDYLKVSYYFEY